MGELKTAGANGLGLGLVLLVLGWYVSNTMSSYYAKNVFNDAESLGEADTAAGSSVYELMSLSLFVSFLQLAISGLVGYTYYCLVLHLPGDSSPWMKLLDSRTVDPAYFKLTFFIATCNAIGTCSTNVGYIYGSVSLVQLIKSTEPVATYIADALVFQTKSNRVTISGILLVIFGSCMACYKDSSANYLSVAAALLSNAVLPLRNIFTKSYSSKASLIPTSSTGGTEGTGGVAQPRPSGFILFSLISSVGSVVVGAAALLAYSLAPFAFSSGANCESLFSSLTYCGYNSFSFLVLGRLDPMTHAMLNVFKRAFNIITSMLFFAQPFTAQFMLGLTISLVGMMFYIAGKKEITDFTSYRRFIPFAVIALMMVFAILNAEGDLASLSELTPIASLPPSTPSQSLKIVPPIRDFGRLAFVPLDPYNACNDKILHLSCLRTIISDGSGPVVEAPHLLEEVCRSLLKENADQQVESAHCGLCLQVQNTVGALVSLTEDDSPAKEEVLSTYLLPSDSQAVVNKILYAEIRFFGSEISVRVVDRVAIAMHGLYPPKSEAAGLFRRKDANVGNFMWMFGATRMINPFTVTFQKDDVAVADQVTNYVIASANAFQLDADPDPFQGYVGFMKSKTTLFNVPTIVLGIGIQAEFGPDDVHGLVLRDHQRDLLLEVQKRQQAASISVRGEFTRTACANAGIKNCIPLGCPSLTISREVDLGKALEEKWEKTLRKLASKEKIKVVLILPAMQPKQRPEDYDLLVGMLVEIYEKHDCVFILQMGYDVVNLQAHMKASNKNAVPEERRVTFYHVEDWLEYVKDFDLVVTTRIHGGMGGVSTSTPTFVIPTDYRILELVDAMQIPKLPMEKIRAYYAGGRLSDDGVDVGYLMNIVEKDFESFERNRIDKLRNYVGILNNSGLEMDPKLLEIVRLAGK